MTKLSPTSDSDENDFTMIHPSIIYEQLGAQSQSQISVVRRNQQFGNEHERKGFAEQLEQILVAHRQELEKSPTIDYDPYQALIMRLIDLIRVSQISNRRKDENLDKLCRDIIEFRQKNEKTRDQLEKEIYHLKSIIIRNPDETDRYNKKIESMCHYEEWTNMSEEIEQLQSLVINQKERIQQLANFILQEQIVSSPPLSAKNDLNNATNPEEFVTTLAHSVESNFNLPINKLNSSSANTPLAHLSLLVCPICQAIFNPSSMNLQQFNVHLDEHLIESHSF